MKKNECAIYTIAIEEGVFVYKVLFVRNKFFNKFKK